MHDIPYQVRKKICPCHYPSIREQYLKDKAINLVVLDELTYMINYKYLDEQVILNTLNARPKNQHVVITGRAAFLRPLHK
jgi:cob(I)alamin adenosyltransferase